MYIEKRPFRKTLSLFFLCEIKQARHKYKPANDDEMRKREKKTVRV